jgi:hypothetical protein
MKGHFSEESLQRFSQLAAESAGIDFAENSYDFARCLMSDGTYYGVSKGETCKLGKSVPDKEKGDDDKKEEKKPRKPSVAKLTKAFRARRGKDLTDKQLAAIAQKIGVPIPSGKSAEDVLQKMLPKGEKVVPIQPVKSA